MLTIEQLKFAREIGATHVRIGNDGTVFYRNIVEGRGYEYSYVEYNGSWTIGGAVNPAGWEHGEVKEIDFSRLDDYSADKEFDIKATGGDIELTKDECKDYDEGCFESMKEDITENEAAKAEDFIYRGESVFHPNIATQKIIYDSHALTSGHSKYHREVKPGVFVDVYDVIKAWGVTNPAQQHLIKKALQAGERGHKDYDEDMDDVIASAIRAKELQK